MFGLALDSNNDIQLGPDGSFKRVSGGAEIAQHVRTRLNVFLGEYFLDLSVGTPYYQELLVSPANLVTVESILKARILSTPGVIELTAFNMQFNRQERILTVNFTFRGEDEVEQADEVILNA